MGPHLRAVTPYLLEAARKRKREEEEKTQADPAYIEHDITAWHDTEDDAIDGGLEESNTELGRSGERDEEMEQSLDTNALIHKLLEVAQQPREDHGPDMFAQSEAITPAVTPPIVTDQAPISAFIDTEDGELGSSVENDTMLPPTRRPSIPGCQDKSEEVSQPALKFDLDSFQMALGLWCQDSAITRQQYAGLLEVLSLLEKTSQIDGLPRSIDALRRRTKARLPLMKIRRQQIPLVAAKLPTAGRHFSTTPMDWLYFFDPKHLFTTLLSSNAFKSKLHLGMAEFVDEPKELWHSPSWGASIRACSGDYAYHDNQPIFPSDVVQYRCSKEQCPMLHLGRVTCIGRDFSSFTPKAGSVTLQVQCLKPAEEMQEFWLAALNKGTMRYAPQPKEFICIEDEQYFILEDAVIGLERNVCLDYRFDDMNAIDPRIGRFDTIIIRRVYNKMTSMFRPLNMSPPIRGELEIAEFGRQYLAEKLQPGRSISVPLLCFMDAFGLYRNMYRSLLGIYFILAGLSVTERKRRANVFILTLGPHASELKHICEVLKPGLEQLDRGIEVMINGEEKVLCAFIMAWLGDMPQQQDNSGFKRQNAARGCRYCSIRSDHRDNLQYDIVTMGRYHHQTLALRQQESRLTKTGWKAVCVQWGLSEVQSPVVALTPALDIIRTRPADPAHSEYAGMAKLAHSLLMNAILTTEGQRRYTATLQAFPFPPGWGRLQSPAHHLDSYRMQEHARASIIIPILLRCWLRSEFIKPAFAATLKIFFVEETFIPMSPANIITHVFASMAKSNSVIMSENMSIRDRTLMGETIRYARNCFQLLQRTAARASARNSRGSRANSRGNSPAANTPSRPPSPFVIDSLPSTPGSEYGAFNISRPGEDKAKEKEKLEEPEGDIKRPNMHIGIHYPDIALEFGTAFNVNVLIGEDKHRDQKKRIMTTNHRDVVWALLSRENCAQTIRFLLLDSYRLTHPDLTTFMHTIERTCPNLFQTILPRSERSSNSDDSSIRILSDQEHSRAAALLCIQPSHAKDVLKLPTRLGELNVVHPFLQDLRMAYDCDYKMPHIINLNNLPVQWCKKFIYTSSSLESRISYEVGNYIQFRGTEIGKIDNIFVHELSLGSRRLFCRVTKTSSRLLSVDPVLRLPSLETTSEQIIIGLPSISTKRLYIIPVEHRENRGELRMGGDHMLLYCNWTDLQFL